MRRLALILPIAASLLSSCGPKALALPEDSVQRAATCGVVAAAGARASGGDVAKPLTIEQSGHVLHYALLAGSEGKAFSNEKAAAVVNTMPGLGDKVTEGKWQELAAPCDAAFPQAASKAPVELPTDTLDAQLGCSALGAYLSKAMASQESAYGDALSDYRRVGTALDAPIASKLSARGINSDDARLAARNTALAKIVKAGSPVPVMNACLAKYGKSIT